MLKSKSYRISSNKANDRFDIVASEVFPELSRKKIKQIIDNGGAYVNKKRINLAKYNLKQGDLIELYWEEKDPQLKNNIPNLVLFTHDDFLIINKPSGVPSQATLSSSKNTVIELVHKSDPKQFPIKDLSLVHRLDKDTSGLMILARNSKSKQIFDQLFKDHKIQKTYQALSFFTPKADSGNISYPIYQDKSRTNCYVAATNPNRVPKDAKKAETNYEVLQHYGKDASLIHCFPKTGRTHQIRVHLSAIGCPILGDKTYAQNVYGHKYGQLALRCMLHAKKLTFVYENETLEFEAPTPEDFSHIQGSLEKKHPVMDL